MLPLYGSASVLRGFDHNASAVVRLQKADCGVPRPEDVALVKDTKSLQKAVAAGFSGVILIGNGLADHKSGLDTFQRLIILPEQFSYLAEGDVLGVLGKTNRVRALYRRNSRHNSFLVTERCNHWCLMCSQPPRDVDDGWILDEITAAIPLIDPETSSLGFTGGEPLLDWRGFIGLLGLCRDRLPRTAIHVLSNGRAFASAPVADAWAKVGHQNLTVGIPIYASVDTVHDYVVQAGGAFDETVLGILRLKDRGQRVEVRVVLHAITAPHIVETCNWLARNLPFVDHVALMGLENTGFAIANESQLWVDPVDYRSELARAILILVAAKMRASVYNLQRCVLDRSVWPYAAQSISDWKNDYLDQCDRCLEKPRCAGFFSSGRPRYSGSIRAITN